MATKRAKKTDVVSPSSAELRKAVEAIRESVPGVPVGRETTRMSIFTDDSA